MGRERTSVDTDTRNVQSAKATAQEEQLNQLLLEQAKAGQPQALQLQESGGNLINAILTGQNLPGTLQGLSGGISEATTQRTVQNALEDVRPGLQKSGLFDSGVRAELETEVAADIRAENERFNINNLMQLLNLGVGGQASNQQALLSQSGQLGAQLSGLRELTGVTNESMLQKGINPFVKSFGQSFGTNIGNPKVKFGSAGVGGS